MNFQKEALGAMEQAVDHERDQTSSQSSPLPCPKCGASNKPGAQWCGQCLTKFASSAPPPPPPPPLRPVAPANSAEAEDPEALLHTLVEQDGGPKEGPARAAWRPLAEKTQKVGAGTVTVAKDGISWTCARCDSTNDIEASVCTVCGAKFSEAIKPVEEPRPARDANRAAMISLFLPGAGHAYLGIWGEGIARAVISSWVVVVAIFAAAQAAPQARVMAILFGLVATGLWMVGAHDAYREASNASRMVLLKKRMFLYLVLGLLTLSIIVIFSTALGANA